MKEVNKTSIFEQYKESNEALRPNDGEGWEHSKYVSFDAFKMKYPFGKSWWSIRDTIFFKPYRNGDTFLEHTMKRIASTGGITMADYIDEANCGGRIP